MGRRRLPALFGGLRMSGIFPGLEGYAREKEKARKREQLEKDLEKGEDE